MANFLRFRKRSDGDFILLNMDHVVSIEAGSPQEDEGEWSLVTLLADGHSTTSVEVLTPLEELAALLAGVWEKGPS